MGITKRRTCMAQEYGEINSSNEVQDEDQATMSREAADAALASAELQDTVEKLESSIDDMLDDIDDVLEVDAEEFINAYIQKGGQ